MYGNSFSHVFNKKNVEYRESFCSKRLWINERSKMCMYVEERKINDEIDDMQMRNFVRKMTWINVL